MALTLDDITQLFASHGGQMYSGEPVTQLQHALQTAYLAELSGADDELVTACLLHDLGHMLNEQGETPTLRGLDDTHQYFALPFLRGLFSDRVLDPIKLHVDAKRYLCRMHPEYHATLSADSKRSLKLQGGIYTEQQCVEFIAQRGAPAAVKLRQWDDQAKQPNLSTPDLAYFMQCAARSALPSPPLLQQPIARST